MKMKEKNIPEIQPFIEISGNDSKEQICKKFQEFKDMGINSAVLQYKAPDKNVTVPFDEIYFMTLRKMSDVCRELRMTYWVQDAAPFPTGAANGKFREPQYFEKGKLYLEERHTNIRGPVENAHLLLESFNGLLTGGIENIMGKLSLEGPEVTYKADLAKVIAMKSNENDLVFDLTTAMDLTESANWEEGILEITLPEGNWRIFFIYETRKGGGRKFFMNLLDSESVKLQMEEVHKLHYDKLKDELGKTWEGFFYDEPEVGNVNGYDFSNLPGNMPERTSMTLPWCKEMPEKLRGKLGGQWFLQLPSLWYDCGKSSRILRYHYMDAVTRLIQDNYNGQVLPWCKERGIRYIGHVVEDENAHTRLGCGTGHFFRVEKYQDMAGIDLIGGQLRPKMDMCGIGWYGSSDGDGEFYHYGLAKLASSEAHINPNKNGYSFCEVNAVYQHLSNGKFYKYLLDHLFVSGINHLIPVITDSLDPVEGKILFTYAKRMCHFMNNSKPQISVAILYHAEAEWAGKFQYFQKPASFLMKNQIDFDVIPGDVLTEQEFYGTKILNHTLKVNEMQYKALVVPYCQYIRKDVLQKILQFYKAGIKVYFIDEYPEGYCENGDNIDWTDIRIPVVPLNDLVDVISESIRMPVSFDGTYPWLRCSYMKYEGKECLFLINEDDQNSLDVSISLDTENISRWDICENMIYSLPVTKKENKLTTKLHLGRLESTMLIFGNECSDNANDKSNFRKDVASGFSWKISYYDENKKKQEMELSALQDISSIEGMKRYTKPLFYHSSFMVEDELPHFLDLGEVGDSAHVFLNEMAVGYRIAAPYIFDISEAVRKGKNKIEIIVRPGVARKKEADSLLSLLSPVTYSIMPKTGLMGPVCFR